MNCKNCSTIGSCPFAFSDESEQAQNYGCLPTPMEILSMRLHHSKTWACHDNHKKPCLGAIQFLKEYNLSFKVIDKNLVTLDDPWNEYITVEEVDATIKLIRHERLKRIDKGYESLSI